MTDETHTRSDGQSVSYDVPDDETPVTCAYCGQPYAREEWLAIHHGWAHPGDLSDEEADAFRAAHDAEETEIREFRLRALGALVAIYFVLLMIYALV
ncbi:C2H2-type zinc finger protein [Halomicroarcula sp. GCM10025709]|uniref:C2H2-type zinc finger protein n=1 Tax=Haloarcula TaxID=2237 RepID=UPI0024C33CCF|nr:C2H2-type zinc finger protein [Halomicroarcula sp. YJ-61-S]